jgi:hypothetical protein
LRIAIPALLVMVLTPVAPELRAQAALNAAGQSQNEIVEQQIIPRLELLARKVIAEKREVTIDGTRAFTGDDHFLPGKVALGLAHALLNTPRSDPAFTMLLAGFSDVADTTVGDVNETWGIYYYMTALNNLRKAGLLDQAVRPATLAKLRHQLDWRTFVRVPEYTLIDLPTNYYGVAFSVARLRTLMGWEDDAASRRLLQEIIDHYEQYSGRYGFSDETNGAGRFDRYSVLLIAEICERLIETDMPATPQLKRWLRNSADVVLINLNTRGDGFSYGRTVGPYGDTGFLEVLAASAYFDVLTPAEKDMAYAFATRATRKFAEFWYDPQMASVNLWEKGRATDAYRNKGRILGENFSLTDQVLKTNDIWNRVGYKNRPPSPGFDAWLRRLPEMTLTWFAKGEYDRALLTRRDGSHVFSLPMINGGPTYHSRNAYFPIPFARDIVDGSPNAEYPQLLAKFTLADGSELMPLSFMRNISLTKHGVRYHQDAMDKVGTPDPVKDDRLAVDVEYVFSPGSIQRRDRFVPSHAIEARKVSMEFASFSSAPRVTGTRVTFGAGAVYEMNVEGLNECHVQAPIGNAVYRASHGSMNTLVTCGTDNITLDRPFTVSWTLKYH